MSLPRPVVLIGLSGAGKSSVARYAAAALGCGWSDLDQRIEEQAGRSVAEIFASSGERYFRELERQAMIQALTGPAQVIAAGAGWAAQPGVWDDVREALVVYLAISPADAAKRLRGDTARPLLQGEDLLQRLEDQFRARQACYALADLELDATVGSAAIVGEGVAAAARQYGGWGSR